MAPSAWEPDFRLWLYDRRMITDATVPVRVDALVLDGVCHTHNPALHTIPSRTEDLVLCVLGASGNLSRWIMITIVYIELIGLFIGLGTVLTRLLR